MEHPWLTVVMPVYNGENYLEQALNSILSQRDDEIEVIAIDGGSTDRTVDILESYAGVLHLTLFIRRELENWVANSNYGLSQAHGDYVSFLHQDDLWLEDRLRILRRLIQRSPDTMMFLHPSWFIDSCGRRVGLCRCPLPSDSELEPGLVVERLLVQNFVTMPTPLFSREAAVRVGGLDEELWYTADWDFWLKIAAAGAIIYHPRPLTAFRIHPQAQTMQGSSDISDFRRQLEIVLARHLRVRESTSARSPMTQRLARFSIEVNTTLAALVHGGGSNMVATIPALSRSGACRLASLPA